MKKLLPIAVSLILASSAAFAQQNVRVRGMITAFDGNTLSLKARDGKDLQLQLAPDAAVATAKRISFADLKPGAYVGVESRKRADDALVAMEVHTLPPQVPSGHISPWDLEPGSIMTNANIATISKLSGANEVTFEYKGGSQKILVPEGTPVTTFVPADRSALKPGEHVFIAARQEADGKLTALRIQASKDGARPLH